jgi:hypothetical protein
MNALLSLEPRIAGDNTLEPDSIFADPGDELHDADRLGNLCLTGTDPSLACVLDTRVCP